jgi:hypothetical protein
MQITVWSRRFADLLLALLFARPAAALRIDQSSEQNDEPRDQCPLRTELPPDRQLPQRRLRLRMVGLGQLHGRECEEFVFVDVSEPELSGC